VLVAGLPPGNTQEYLEIVPFGLVPEPLKETDWPMATETLEEGLVMVAVGGTSVGLAESWTN